MITLAQISEASDERALKALVYLIGVVVFVVIGYRLFAATNKPLRKQNKQARRREIEAMSWWALTTILLLAAFAANTADNAYIWLGFSAVLVIMLIAIPVVPRLSKRIADRLEKGDQK